MAEESNLYAVEKNAPLLNSTLTEIEQFLGMHIIIMVVRMPSKFLQQVLRKINSL